MQVWVGHLYFCALLVCARSSTAAVSVGDETALLTALLDPAVASILLTGNIVLDPTVWLPTSQVVSRIVTIDGGSDWPVLDFNYVKDAVMVVSGANLTFNHLIIRGDTASPPDLTMDWLASGAGATPVTFNSVVRAMTACPPIPTLIPLLEAKMGLPTFPAAQSAVSVRSLTCADD